MSATVVSSTSQSGLSVTSLNVEYPTAGGGQGGGTPPSATDSAYVVAYFWHRSGGATITGPSGWTGAPNSPWADGDDNGLAVFFKTYDGSVSSFSAAFSGAADVLAVALLVQGVNISTPATITVSEAQSTTNLNPVTQSITTLYTDTLVLGVWGGHIFKPFAAPNYVPSESIAYATVSAIASGPHDYSLTIAWAIKASIGAITRTANSNAAVGTGGSLNTIAAGVALNPYLGPSAPTIVTPNGGESITVGRTYSVTWLAATDPDTAQSSLTYAVEYSANDGTSWTVLTAATAAGATSYSWNTTGLTPGTQYRIRIKASDGSNVGPYDTSDNTFTILADNTPGAPITLSPNGTVFDRAQAKVFTWVFNDPGDVQTAFQIQASTDDFATTPVDTGTVSSATSSHSFAGSTFSHGNWKWRVRTKDNAGTFGAYSASATFLAGDKPATPNITAPTAGSPPSTATPTHTWTSTGQVARKVRITTGGGEIYNSGKIVSAAVSIPSPINYANGVEYVLYISIWNVDDLQSDEDSETFTPSYTAPATPTVTATAVADGGYIQVTVANSDTPDHNDLYRYVTSEGAASKIRICAGLAVDGTFRDYNVKSGVEYSYIARAVSVADLIADSSADADTLTLAAFWLHLVNESPVTSNSSTALGYGQIPPGVLNQAYIAEQKRPKGRTRCLTVFGQVLSRQISARFVVPNTDTATGPILATIFEANGIVCARDQAGNLLFGRLVSVPTQDNAKYSVYQVVLAESDFDEEV